MTQQTTPRAGHEAPPFELDNQDGTTVSLNDFHGRWIVLYAYPKDDTPGCTTEACDFTAGLSSFTKLNAAIVGISPDSPRSHRKFIEKYDLKVTLLSDPDHAMLKAYGAWGMKKNYGKEYEGVIRTTVLINPEGIVTQVWPAVNVEGHADAVRAALEEFSADN